MIASLFVKRNQSRFLIVHGKNDFAEIC